MKRILRVLTIILSLFLLVTGSGIQAQNDHISIIPVRSVGYLMAVSSDARLIATSELSAIHNDEVLPEYLPIHVFNSESREEIFTLEGFTDYASSLAFNEDGSLLASYHPNGWIYLWDMTNGTLIREIPSIPLSPAILRFIPGRNLLIQTTVTGFLPTIMVWDLDTGAIVSMLMERFNSRGQLMDYMSEARAPESIIDVVLVDEQTVIVSTANNNIIEWNISTDERRILRDDEETLPYFDIRKIYLTPDGETLVYNHVRNETVYLLNMRDRTETPLFERDVELVATASDADVIAWVMNVNNTPAVLTSSLANFTDSNGIVLPEPQFSPEFLRLRTPLASMAISPDGSRIILGGFYNEDGENVIAVIDNVNVNGNG